MSMAMPDVELVLSSTLAVRIISGGGLYHHGFTILGFLASGHHVDIDIVYHIRNSQAVMFLRVTSELVVIAVARMR
jgi:hypothetical protein